MSTATRETFNQWFSELEATWPEPPREIAGARMLTAQLQPGHWAGVTACSEELARHRLTGAGIAVPAHLVHCDSVDEVGRRIPPKPHPAPFARGYELLGVPIAETLTLGDSPNDHKSALAAAQLAGSELSSVCVGVAVNTAVARALLESGALFTVPDLRQLTVSLGKDGYTAQGRVLSTPQAFEQLSQRPGFGVGGQRAFAERSSDAGLTG